MLKSSIFRLRFVSAIAVVGLLSPSLMADNVFTGVQASASTATTSDSNAGVTVGGNNDFAFFGGEGNADAISYNTTYGASGDISHNSFLNPILKARSAGFDSEAARSTVGLMATYQYNGATAGTVTYDWTLHADLVEDDPSNAAFLRFSAGLVTNADFYTTSHNDFVESSATVNDSVTLTSSENGTIDTMGSLTIDLDPGEVFYLTSFLQTYAGRGGAITDAFNTSTGSFSVSNGGSITSLSAVPEPTSGIVLAMLGLIGCVVRRRK